MNDCSVADASVATLQEMNPLVKVSVQQGTVDIEELDFVQAYQVSALADIASVVAMLKLLSLHHFDAHYDIFCEKHAHEHNTGCQIKCCNRK